MPLDGERGSVRPVGRCDRGTRRPTSLSDRYLLRSVRNRGLRVPHPSALSPESTSVRVYAEDARCVLLDLLPVHG